MIGGSGRSENFEAALLQKLQSTNASGVEDMEKALYEACITPGVQVQFQEKRRPWQSDGIFLNTTSTTKH